MELWGLRRDGGPVVFPEVFCLVSPVLNDESTFESAEIKPLGSVVTGQYLFQLIPASLLRCQPHHSQLRTDVAQQLPSSTQLLGLFHQTKTHVLCLLFVLFVR